MFRLIAGPCVIESSELAMEIAAKLKELTISLPVEFYFKASFDKANRTSIDSYRGPGLKEGMRILADIKEKLDVKITTDIHEPWQAEQVAEVADMLQIPAFLCRQTDLLVAAGKTEKLINIKKAQFLAADDMKYVASKVESTGNHKIMLCERGTTFGYHNLVVDMTSIVQMKQLGYPVIIDATHSVQKPGAGGGVTLGNREYAEYIARAAIAVGADGVFMEVHPNPDAALSDGPNMIPLNQTEDMMRIFLQLYSIVH